MNNIDLSKYIVDAQNIFILDVLESEFQERFFDNILMSAKEITDSEEGAILVVDHNLGYLRIEKWIGPGVEKENRMISFDENKSVCVKSVKSRKTIKIDNTAESALFLPKSRSKILSELVVPVFIRQEIVGLINLESIEENHYTSTHVANMINFCKAISNLWALARLIDWQCKYKINLDVINQINKAIINDSSEKTLTIIEGAIKNLVNADIIDILLLNEERTNLYIHAIGNIKKENQNPIPRGTGVVWECIEDKKIRIIPDTSIYPGYKAITKNVMRSELCVPLIKNNDAIGVINLESEKLYNFSLDDANIIQLFSDQALVVIVNSRMLTQLQASKSLANLGSATGNFAHKLNNIVGGIRMNAELLNSDLEEREKNLAKKARQIRSDAIEALDVVDQYVRFFESSSEIVDLVEMVTQLCERIKVPENINIIKVLPEIPILYKTSKKQMEELVTELIKNSIKSIKGTGRIEVGVIEYEYVIVLTVSDDGKGIDSAKRETIFTMGGKDRDPDRTGVGFGLWWIDNFLKSIGGYIQFLDHEGGGIVAEVKLPKKSIFNDGH